MPALLLVTGPSAGLRYDVKTEVVLGRSPSCEIPLEDGRVSRRHARVWLEDGQTKLADLGSRNGTLVNGEPLEGEGVLLPGDRVQVGETTILFEPPSRASLADRETGLLEQQPVEEVLPHVGPEAALFTSGVALLSATSEAMVLRRAAEEALRVLEADATTALLGGTEGLLTAAVAGADRVQVPRRLAQGVLARRELARTPEALCAPVVASGGAPFGVLYAERASPPLEARDASLLAALGRLAGEALASVRAQHQAHEGTVHLVGTSAGFRRSLEGARRAASGEEPVVLHGEGGAGTTLLARYVHARSARGLGPLVEVDCRRAPLEVEEQLFGRGSTPGVPPLSSALLRADGGVLLLEGVDRLARPAAERLARLLTRGQAPSRGGGEEPVDVRVLATACAPLGLLAARGDFDAELARLLSTSEVEVAPLRERTADIPALFEHFALEASRPLRREPPRLSPEARRMLVEYAWPHNVRELRLVAERMALLYAGTGEVPALRLPPELQQGTSATQTQATQLRTLAELVQQLERNAIAEALRQARGKKIHAAALLGISRPTLDKKIEDYQLVVEKVRASR